MVSLVNNHLFSDKRNDTQIKLTNYNAMIKIDKQYLIGIKKIQN